MKILIVFLILIGVYWMVSSNQPLPEPIATVKLPAEVGTKLFSIKLDQGKKYDLVLLGDNIPVDNHEWKMRVKVEISSPSEVKETVEGSPKKNLDKDTSGDGNTYYTRILIHRFTAKEEGEYFFKLLECKHSEKLPGDFSLRLLPE